MSTYLMLTTLTDEGRKTIKYNPEALNEMNKEIELMGIKIVAQYALLGQYDFVNIVEATNDEDAARLAINLSAGGIMQTLTLAAMRVEDLILRLKKQAQKTQERDLP
ncbi:GYD domain-containing protein [Chloroflexota bacterium]